MSAPYFGNKRVQMSPADAARLAAAKARATALGLTVFIEETSGRLVVGDIANERVYLADGYTDLDRIEAALDILEGDGVLQ